MADVTKMTDDQQNTYSRALQIGATGLKNQIKLAGIRIADAEAIIATNEADRDDAQAMLDTLIPDVDAVAVVIAGRPVEGMEAL